MRRKWLTTALKYGIGLALTAGVIWRYWEPRTPGGVGLKSALSGPMRVDFFAVSAVLIACVVLITFVRWYLLVRAQDLPFTLRDAFRLGLVGYFFNAFLPGSVGGDLLKAAIIAREQRRRAVAVSTVLIDRGIGLWGLIGLCALAGGVSWARGDPVLRESADLQWVVRFAVGIMVGTGVLWILLGVLPERRAHRFAQRLHSIPRVGKILAEFWRAVWLYRSRATIVLGTLLMSMGTHVLTVLAFYFAARTFQPPGAEAQIPGLPEHFILVPVGKTVQGLAFFAPGGLGAAEYVFALSYDLLHYPGGNAVKANFGMRMAEWLLGFAGYLVYLRMKRDLNAALLHPDQTKTTDSNSPEGSSSTTEER